MTLCLPYGLGGQSDLGKVNGSITQPIHASVGVFLLIFLGVFVHAVERVELAIPFWLAQILDRCSLWFENNANFRVHLQELFFYLYSCNHLVLQLCSILLHRKLLVASV